MLSPLWYTDGTSIPVLDLSKRYSISTKAWFCQTTNCHTNFATRTILVIDVFSGLILQQQTNTVNNWINHHQQSIICEKNNVKCIQITWIILYRYHNDWKQYNKQYYNRWHQRYWVQYNISLNQFHHSHFYRYCFIILFFFPNRIVSPWFRFQCSFDCLLWFCGYDVFCLKFVCMI